MSPAAGQPGRHLILVAGAGRSGTSLVTGLMGRLGVRVPLPEVTADDSNPTGFGEPRWAVDFHNELLQAANVAAEDGRPEAWDAARAAGERPEVRDRLSAWLDEQLAEAPRVVVKDPRLAWFLPLYTDVARDLDVNLAVLTMLRHPAESVKSRELAYGTKRSPTTRAVSWLNMMLGTETRTRPLPRAFVHYEDLLADWHAELEVAEGRLGIPLLSGCDADRVADAGSLVDPSLRRAAGSWDELGVAASVQQLADRTYAALSDLRRGDGPAEAGELDALAADFRSLYEEAAEISRSRVRAARVEERRKARAERAPAPRASRLRTAISRVRRR